MLNFELPNNVQQNTLCLLTLEDLQTVMKQCVALAIAEYAEIPQIDNNDSLISKEEVMKRLNVSTTTLWRWNKDRYLVWHKVGGRAMYKLSDVKTIQGTL